MFKNVLLVLYTMLLWILTCPVDAAQVDSTFIKSVDEAYQKGEISRDSALEAYYSQALTAFDNYDFGISRRLLDYYESLLAENDSIEQANSKLLYAQMLMEEGERADAIEYLSESLSIYKSLKDSSKYMLVLLKLGHNYNYIGDHIGAREYYNDCIEIAHELNNLVVEGSCLYNIGGTYADDENYDKGFDFYNRAIALANESLDKELLHKIYHAMSLDYKNQGNYKLAEDFGRRSLSVSREMKSKRAIGFSYQGLGMLFFDLGNLDSSEYYMDQTLSIANEISNHQLGFNAKEILEQIYYKTGNYKQAYDTYKQMMKQEDSLYTLQNTQLLASIKEKYQNEKQERELAEKNLQLQEADSNLIRQRNTQLILVFVVVLLILITILIYRGYTLRQRANDILQSKNAEIQEHLKEIEHVNANKSRWFVNVAHELRTPLTLIKGPIQRILRNSKLSTNVHADLQLVERNTKSLSNLVNEILDLSRMEEGEVSVKESVFELGDMIMTVVAAFESRADQLGIQLKSQINTEAHILADKDKLNKVLINLISNALKFTPSGGNVEVILARPKSKAFRIIVKDNGRGIPPADINRVFDRFFQSNRDSQEVTGGTGIGLALSKEIAEMHGGQLSVTSTPGMGSSFTLVLPEEIEASRPPFGANKTTVEEVESGLVVSSDGIINVDRKPKLLLLEDNEDMASYIASLLSDHFEVKAAKSGIMGLEMLGSYDIKFIISDIMMPEMDGVTFLKKVKSDLLWRHLPFIHLTALSDENLKKELLRIGIDDYLMKPFDQEELIIRVHNLYNNYIQRISLDGESKQEVSHDEKMMNILKKEVLTHLEDTNFNVLRLADGAAMSERQLYRYLKSATGLTPLQFIQEIKLTRANDLARKKVYSSTSELSSAVGFKQPAYFATLFEKRFGKKPAVILKA